MDKVFAKLLCTPEIFYNEQSITFPFRKAEALFYYLLVKKKASRDELVNLLWGEVGERVGKKNLRNAVYMIRRLFKRDVIVSPQRSILMLNEEIEWIIDLDKFLEDEEADAIKEYKGDFLQGLLVKDADNFEYWMFRERDAYKDIYVHKLYERLNQYMEEKNFTKAEFCCKKLIETDELNEDAYRMLMNIYQAEGQHNKGIEIYHKLVEVLDKELAITPDGETTNLFERLLKEKSMKEKLDQEGYQEFYYGREKECQLLKKNFYKFTRGNDAKSFVILGEAGIGKSRLVDEFFKTSNVESVYIFKTYCYQAEENSLLKPWNSIFSKLSKLIHEENIQISPIWKNIVSTIFPVFYSEDPITDINLVENGDILKYQVVEKAVVNILSKVSEEKKIILFFEDLQWIDEMSLSLLKNLILENRNTSVMVIITCRDSYEQKIDQFFTQMIRYSLIHKLALPRLSKKEVSEFAQKALPNYSFTEELKNLLYKETEGNTFFLVEFLKNLEENKNVIEISPTMKDILKNRILNVSSEGQKILNIASIFFDKVTFSNLQTLSEKKDFELIDILDELQGKGLMNEIIGEGEIEFVFTHQKLREYIYKQMSLSRRRILHNRIGSLLEGQLKNKKVDRLLYPKLVYHFCNGGNKLKALKYRMKNISEYLQFSHEIFPVLGHKAFVKDKYLYMDQKQAFRQLHEMKNLIEEVRAEYEQEEEFKNIELLFLYMLGRYHIRQGEYDLGLSIMKKVIGQALGTRKSFFALKGYKQMIYYCMNIQNTEDMRKYLEKAFEIANEAEDKGIVGILLRLKGYLKIMEGDYEEGEKVLKQAIEVLNTFNDGDKYILNIAAAYHFIGESKRYCCNFQEAVYYYNQAISICEEKKMVMGLGIIYTNAGQAVFDMGDDDQARYYFDKALEIYSQLDYLWGRSIANGYKALLLIKEEKYQEGLAYLKKAEEDAKKLKSPYEIGLVSKIKEELGAYKKKLSDHI